MSEVVTKGRMSRPDDDQAFEEERAADRIRFLIQHARHLWDIHAEHGTTFADPVFAPGIPDRWSSEVVDAGSWVSR